MSLSLAQNPIRLVYAALWSLLESSSTFSSLVATGNRIKFTGTALHADSKGGLSQADVPEVRIVLDGFKPHIRATSNGCRLTLTWKIQVASGDMRFETLLDVQWAIYCVLADWGTVVKAITWNSTQFVKDCYAVEVTETNEDQKQNRGIRGWSTVWSGVTDCWFATTAIDAVT